MAQIRDMACSRDIFLHGIPLKEKACSQESLAVYSDLVEE